MSNFPSVFIWLKLVLQRLDGFLSRAVCERCGARHHPAAESDHLGHGVAGRDTNALRLDHRRCSSQSKLDPTTPYSLARSLARSLLLTLPSSPQATLTDSTGKATSFSSVSGWDALRNNSWRIDMPAQAASFGAATFSLVEDAGSGGSGGSATGAPITLTNVLFGDVHLCSGKGVLF